jgi:hypothetical protein
MAGKKNVVVTVVEENEIAGEVSRTNVWVFRCRLVSEAYRWADERWGANPPKGSQIKDEKTGTVYELPYRIYSLSGI